MELIIILCCTVCYFVIALIFVFYIRKKTELKLYRRLAISLVILLPTWDVLFGFIVYRVAVISGVPSVVINETVTTDGMYYEGENNVLSKIEDEPLFIGGFRDNFKNNFTYAESKVVEQYNGQSENMKIKPALYRCERLPTIEQKPNHYPAKCYSIDKPMSKYAVIVSDFKLGIAEIKTKRIIDRSNGKLLAQFRQVVSDGYLGILLWNNGPIPFFNWLNWWKNTAPGLCSPDCASYYSFEYKVLKPKE